MEVWGVQAARKQMGIAGFQRKRVRVMGRRKRMRLQVVATPHGPVGMSRTRLKDADDLDKKHFPAIPNSKTGWCANPAQGHAFG